MTWLKQQWRREAWWICALFVVVPYAITWGLLAWIDQAAQASTRRTESTGSVGRPLEARTGQYTRGGPLAPPAEACAALRQACGGGPTLRIEAPTNAPR